MSKRKVNNKIIIGGVDDKSPRRITFDGRKIKYSNLEHQHLSNIYWFNTIIHNREHEYDGALLVEINNRFKGEILSYKPLKRFRGEIKTLRRIGCVLKHHDQELIIFNSKIVGEIE